MSNSVFPHPAAQNVHPGLTKHELLAAIALHALVSSDRRDSPEKFAWGAKALADALIAEFAK